MIDYEVDMIDIDTMKIIFRNEILTLPLSMNIIDT